LYSAIKTVDTEVFGGMLNLAQLRHDTHQSRCTHSPNLLMMAYYWMNTKK